MKLSDLKKAINRNLAVLYDDLESDSEDNFAVCLLCKEVTKESGVVGVHNIGTAINLSYPRMLMITALFISQAAEHAENPEDFDYEAFKRDLDRMVETIRSTAENNTNMEVH